MTSEAWQVGRREFNSNWSVRRKVTAFQELGGSAGAQWDEVTLPHDALISTPRTPHAAGGETSGYFEGGTFEYRKVLDVPASTAGMQVHLEFDGVYRDAMVYVNGALAGQHAFGYSRFTVRIDPYLHVGQENELRVTCRANVDSRWYTGAGIYRDVHMIVKAPVHIALDGVCVTTPDVDQDQAVVDGEVTVRNADLCTTTVRVNARVLNAAGVEVAASTQPLTLLPGESGRVRARMSVEAPDLWSAETPTLYRLAVEVADGDIVLDAEEVVFGIRTLQVDPVRGLRINGQSVKLRGACIHSDNGPLGAAAIGRAEERKIELLKAAGFNAIRSSHHPASSALLDACDRLGMYVMDETFDMWTSSKSDDDYASDFGQWWERDVESLVLKDRNHPSVIFYSIGNEIPELGSPTGGRWSRLLAEKVRSLDPTRLVTNGVNGFVAVLDSVLEGMKQRREATSTDSGSGVNGMMTEMEQFMGQLQSSPMVTTRTEEAYAVLDVAGMNYGEARYELDKDLFPGRVIVGTETWPAQIDRNWQLVTQHDHVIGDFTWTGMDYLGEVGIGVVRYADGTEGASTSFSTSYPGLTAGCGDLDIIGQPGTISAYRQTVFGLRSEPSIAVQRPGNYGREISVATPWSWSDTIASWTWHGYEGHPVRVEVYSDADEVDLLLDGALVARAEVGRSRAFRADFELTYRPGELTAVALRDGIETGRSSLTSASTSVVLRAEADRSQVEANTRDLVFVDLTLTDEMGRVQNGSDRQVRVSVHGPGVLQGLGSGARVSDENFGSGERRTVDGRALAIVRPTGLGEITVVAEADGCEPEAVVVQVL